MKSLFPPIERVHTVSISTQYEQNKPICNTGERIIPCTESPTGSRGLHLSTRTPKADAALI